MDSRFNSRIPTLLFYFVHSQWVSKLTICRGRSKVAWRCFHGLRYTRPQSHSTTELIANELHVEMCWGNHRCAVSHNLLLVKFNSRNVEKYFYHHLGCIWWLIQRFSLFYIHLLFSYLGLDGTLMIFPRCHGQFSVHLVGRHRVQLFHVPPK